MTSATHAMPRSAQTLRQQQGYVMLMLLLIIALLIISVAAIVPTIAFEIRRDRDEELVHRGVQYTRAIRAFSKKTGRFPHQLEELRETNGLRFIRKLYKDPITGKDFKPLHITDIPVPGQPAPNLNPSDAANGAEANGDGTTGGAPDSEAGNPAGSVPPPGPGSSGALAPGAGALATNSVSTNPSSNVGASSNGAGPQPGLLIMGVVSTSKARSIREFDKKKHYNEWLFFYDPRYDRGYEIKGPTSLTITGAPFQTAPGIPGAQNPGAQNPGAQTPGSQFPGTQSGPSFGAPSSPPSQSQPPQ